MIAVIGANGQLGTAFLSLLGNDALSVDRISLDLADLEAIPGWIARHRPDVVINCAAYTAVDAAEQDREMARLVNAVAVGALAAAAKAHGSRLVTFSSDYVFDGTKATGYVESDSTNPLSIYGQTKLEGEHLALAANPETLVIRTSWLLSGTHPNFAATMLELMRKGTVTVVDDQRGRPTLVDDLAAATVECIEAGVTGILHLTNGGETSWFELAREIAVMAGLGASLVAPTSTARLARPAPRPANSVLDSERVTDLGITPLPHYRTGLHDIVSFLESGPDPSSTDTIRQR